MTKMIPYPTAKTMPNRKQRKGSRYKVFHENQKATEVGRKARQAARKEAVNV